jgi:hypothetical protein
VHPLAFVFLTRMWYTSWQWLMFTARLHLIRSEVPPRTDVRLALAFTTATEAARKAISGSYSSGWFCELVHATRPTTVSLWMPQRRHSPCQRQRRTMPASTSGVSPEQCNRRETLDLRWCSQEQCQSLRKAKRETSSLMARTSGDLHRFARNSPRASLDFSPTGWVSKERSGSSSTP